MFPGLPDFRASVAHILAGGRSLSWQLVRLLGYSAALVFLTLCVVGCEGPAPAALPASVPQVPQVAQAAPQAGAGVGEMLGAAAVGALAGHAVASLSSGGGLMRHTTPPPRVVVVKKTTVVNVSRPVRVSAGGARGRR
jgi:hypothetical protein